jgi:hypothetical protein
MPIADTLQKGRRRWLVTCPECDWIGAGRSNVPRDAATARAVEHAVPERIVEVSVALAIDAIANIPFA